MFCWWAHVYHFTLKSFSATPQRGWQKKKKIVCTKSSAHVRYMLRGTPPGTLSARCSVGMHSFSSESAEINPGQAGGGMYLLLVKQTLQTKTTGSHRSLFSRIWLIQPASYWQRGIYDDACNFGVRPGYGRAFNKIKKANKQKKEPPCAANAYMKINSACKKN